MESQPESQPATGPTVRRRPGGRSARVRASVLGAALAELTAVGYTELSLESVARRAGVNKTTVYRRWGTREALLLDMLLDVARVRVPIPDTGSVRTDLARYTQQIVASITTPEITAIARTFAAEAGRSPAVADAGRRFWGERFGLARDIFCRGIDRGELPAGIDPDLLIEILLGPLYLRLLTTGEPLTAEFADQVADIVLAAARAQRDAR